MDHGSVYGRCGCRDRSTGRLVGARCPGLRSPQHGSWYFSADLPSPSGQRRRVRRAGSPPGRRRSRRWRPSRPRQQARSHGDDGGVAHPVGGIPDVAAWPATVCMPWVSSLIMAVLNEESGSARVKPKAADEGPGICDFLRRGMQPRRPVQLMAEALQSGVP
jgi:hypothetical protein